MREGICLCFWGMRRPGCTRPIFHLTYWLMSHEAGAQAAADAGLAEHILRSTHISERIGRVGRARSSTLLPAQPIMQTAPVSNGTICFQLDSPRTVHRA